MPLRTLVVLGLVACATAAPTPTPAAPPVFDFHSSPWLNLHLSLYREAILRKLGRPAPPPGADWSEAERASWEAAVTTYLADAVPHDLLFDDAMVQVGLALVRLEGAPHLADPAIPPSLTAALEATMPAYRAHRFTDDDARNRAYIAALSPAAERVAPAVIADLVRLYGSPWPTGPIRVDVAAYAGRFGAYTSLGPVHITIAASEPHNQLPDGLEIPFHEASHALVDPIQDAIDRELAAQGKSSRDLWHALLFYTTGEVMRRHVPGHVPYAQQNGLWSRGDWPAYLRALDAAWKPYLDGKIGREQAIHDLVAAI